MFFTKFFLFSLLFIWNRVGSADTECPFISQNNDRRFHKNKLRLVQYNVQWLFIDKYKDCPGNGCDWVNITEAEIHLDSVIKRIQYLDPDIINFCEVEGCDELNLLKEKLDGTYLPYLKKGTDTATGQNVGMLTRIDPFVNLYRTETRYNYPIEGSQCGYNYTQEDSSGVSKHYITEFFINNINIAFISAHLVAIPTEPSRCSQREAQASVLQEVIVDYLNKDYEIIMLGDFNDYDDDLLDVNGNKPTSKTLDILKGAFGKYAGLYSLTSIAETIPQEERYSEWWDSDNNCETSSLKDYSMIDHILVTDTISKYIVNSFIYHGYDEYCGKYDSDHYPVVIDLSFY